MATSGTYTATFDNADFISDAFERCGKDPDSLTQRHLDSAIRSLDFILTEWANRGEKQYKIEQFTLTSAEGFTTGAQSVTLEARVMRVLTCYHRKDGLDTPVHEIGRHAYNAIHKKTQQASHPTQYFVDRQRSAPILYPWPTIDNANDSLIISALVRMQDVGSLSDEPDISPLWKKALVMGLAADLAEKYAQDREILLAQKAERAFMYAQAEDRDTGPTRIRPQFGRR